MRGEASYFSWRDLNAILLGLVRDERRVLEKEFAAYLGAPFALATSYGRTALYAGLKAIGVEGKEVILPAFTCTVVRRAVKMAGAVPRFVDIDPEHFTFNEQDLRKKINARTKAVVLTHYFGIVARNTAEVVRITKEHDLELVEDCAHSLGAELEGKKVGLLGDFGIFSLTKGIVNFGGGMLVTNDRGIYERASTLLNREQRSRKTRLADSPLLFSYGVGQFLEKSVYSRPGGGSLKWQFASLPEKIIRARHRIMNFGRGNRPSTGVPQRHDIKYITTGENIPDETYEQERSLCMEPVIAGLARIQLGRIDAMIKRRQEICKLLAHLDAYRPEPEGALIKDAFTHAPLRYPGKNILSIIENAKSKGLLLVPTWPTHQTLWPEQDTDNVHRIANECAIWNVHPELTEKEFKCLLECLNN
jgi:dTDP-4-amino-4,6-dideoxygalactose transaminase